MSGLDRLVFEDDNEDGSEPTGPADAETIEAWEIQVGEAIPALLRSIYAKRDGGMIRDTSVFLHPIDLLSPLDPSYLEEHPHVTPDEVADPPRILGVASDVSNGSLLLLNYNVKDSSGEPAIYSVHPAEQGSIRKLADSLEEYLTAALQADDAPRVDWSEGENAEAVVAKVALGTDMIHDADGEREQVLLKTSDAFILLVKDTSPEGLVLTRSRLPLPLDASAATIRSYWPPPYAAFALTLQPQSFSEIVHEQSRQTSDKLWQNTETHGVPIFVEILGDDRQALVAIRDRIFEVEPSSRWDAADAQAEEAFEIPFTSEPKPDPSNQYAPRASSPGEPPSRNGDQS